MLSIQVTYKALSKSFSQKKRGKRRTDFGIQAFMTGTEEIIKDSARPWNSTALMTMKILPDILVTLKHLRMWKSMHQSSLQILILWLMLKRLGRIWRRQTRFFSLRRRLL
jgi:hypothetical protein